MLVAVLAAGYRAARGPVEPDAHPARPATWHNRSRPGPGSPLGTTQGQYDIFYGVVWGTRTAFEIGLIVTRLTVLIGGTLGAISAYAGGWVDEAIQRVVEIFLAFPFLLAALDAGRGPRAEAA